MFINLGVDILETYESKYLLVIQSQNHAIFLYNEILKRGCKIEFISTPMKISTGCSVSIVFNESDTKIIVEQIKKSNIQIKGIYKIFKNETTIDYIRI